MKCLVMIATAIILLPAGASADVILGQPRIVGGDPAGSTGDLMLGSKKLGTFLGGQFIMRPGGFSMSDASPLDKEVAGIRNPNVIKAGVGNAISFCPALSCIYGPPDGSNVPAFYDHQRTSLLISSETNIDMQAEEQTLAVMTTINKGKLKNYASNTSYSLGDNVLVGAGFGGAIYRVVQAGTTSASSPPPGTRPNAVPFVATDGTVQFQWINDSAIAAKVGIYNEAVLMPGGGNSWAQANNYEMHPGSTPNFNINTEFDFSNNSGTDCEFGINCIGLYVGISGANMATAGINILSSNKEKPGAIWGLRLNSPHLAREAAIAIDANSKYGIAANQFGLGGDFFSEAFIFDNSSGKKSITIGGNKSVATIEDNSNSPVGLNVGGTKTLTGIREASTGPVGLKLDGNYSSAQIIGNNWNVSPAGVIQAGGLNVTGITYQSGGFVPGSSSTPCSPGQAAWDANYEYRCVATNTWKRAALSTW